MSAIRMNCPNGGICAVIPVLKPTVPNAEITSKKIWSVVNFVVKLIKMVAVITESDANEMMVNA